MITSCDHNHHSDEARRKVQFDISEYGCHIIYVMATSYLPGFAYTIGLFENYNVPEIICFGLKNDLLGSILNDACDRIKNGEKFVAEEKYGFFLEGYQVHFLTVDRAFYENYLGYGIWYKESNDFPVLQLVWPDKHGKFPWEDDFNSNWEFEQPLLDRSTDFKFYEKRNTAVYTSKQVLDGSPILCVYHDEDGDWQFHSELSPNIEDARIVCFDQIVKIDPSVNDIFNLEFGWRAWRESPSNLWEKEGYLSEE